MFLSIVADALGHVIITSCLCAKGTDDSRQMAESWTLFVFINESFGLFCCNVAPLANCPDPRGQTRAKSRPSISTGKDKEEEEEEKLFLSLLQEDIRYQRRADEKREAETREGSSLCLNAWL